MCVIMLFNRQRYLLSVGGYSLSLLPLQEGETGTPHQKCLQSFASDLDMQSFKAFRTELP